MRICYLFIITISLFFAELLYFRIANHFKIHDEPNHRSSHSELTIRGGGIIFLVAMACYPIFFNFNYHYFLAGLYVASLISFLDDLNPVDYKTRILCHFIAVGLLFFQLGIFSLPGYVIMTGFFIAIGIINAINFMDGINGMTGSYALITLASLLYINEYTVKGFTASNLIITAMLAVVVFNFFNFRNRAKCFAGDVGSVSLAFILLFFIGRLITTTGNPAYILLLFVYGMDTVTTIIFRLYRKENIFEPHRSHYFQYLVNEKRIAHLYVSSAYSLVQLIFNFLLIFYLLYSWTALLVFAFGTTYLFVSLRFRMEGKERLLKYATD